MSIAVVEPITDRTTIAHGAAPAHRRRLEIRRDPGNAALPVIMMVGPDRPGALIAAERAGSTGLVAKPLHPHDLIRRLLTAR